ncbi:SCP-2 sterol transfer family protein [bacterium BMS3Bbin10]|nr:SCP-2 sterol transfer family protein [bacterium BMS3Bbin10]
MTLTLPVMITNKPLPGARRPDDAGARGFARLLPPVPLFALQPLLGHIVRTVARRHPELIARLGDNCKKRFLIDPYNLPFFLLLQPDPDRPQLRAHTRGQDVEHDVHISGTLVTLLRMIDGQSDSDALFFNRDLAVTGDTEAVVALRNALDNMDATLADDVAACFGPLSRPVRGVIDLTLKFASQKP